MGAPHAHNSAPWSVACAVAVGAAGACVAGGPASRAACRNGRRTPEDSAAGSVMGGGVGITATYEHGAEHACSPKRTDSPPESTDRLVLSVVLITRNRAAILGDSIDWLLDQDLDGKKYEVILNPDEVPVKTVKGLTRKVLSVKTLE